MKHRRYWAIGLAIQFFSFQIINAEWEHTNGPGAGRILSLSANTSTVFAGLNGGGIYRSTDGGEMWIESNAGISSDEVVTALLATDTFVLAGTLNGLYRSTDNGLKWVAVGSGIKVKRFTALALAGKNILAGTELDGVYLSTNNGADWKQVNSGITDSCVLAFAVSGSQIFAGTRNSIYKSTNNGLNWTKVYTHPLMVFKSLTICGNTVIAGASPIVSDGSIGVLISNDGGNNWVSAEPGLKYKKVEYLFTTGNTVIAATLGDGIHISYDNGKTWKASSGLTCNEVTSLTSSGSRLFAGTEGGVFRSDDRGISWTLSSAGITRVGVTALVSVGDIIYAGTEKNGVYFSRDNGSTWMQAVAGLTGKRICSIAANGSSVFAGTDSMGIFRKQHNGSAWEGVGGGIVKTMPVVDLTAIDNTVFAKTAFDVFRSLDNGERWATIKASMPSGGGTAFAAKGGVLFTGADSGVFYSTDNGAEWKAANKGISGYKVISLAATGSSLFAGTYLHGVFHSEDDGKTWKKSNEWSFSVEGLIPIDDRTVAGFSSISVFYSADNGSSWHFIETGIPSPSFISFTATKDMLFVGTRSNGIFRAPISKVIKPAGTIRPPTLPSGGAAEYFSVNPLYGNRSGGLNAEFRLDRTQNVKIDIYNIRGEKVSSPVNKRSAPGYYSFRFNTERNPSAFYILFARIGEVEYFRRIAGVR